MGVKWKGMKEIREEKHTPIPKRVGVVVTGGGIAGISVALAAAQSGANVLLIEKQCILGGLATPGLVCVYLPSCDGEGYQVSCGITEELFRLLIRHGVQGRYPVSWLNHGTMEERKNARLEVQFNPVYLALLTEELLQNHDMELLYDTVICGIHVMDGRLDVVIIKNKSGGSIIEAAVFVDATGDADSFWHAGAQTVEYIRRNTLAAWYYSFGRNDLKLDTLGFADILADSDRSVKEPLSGRHFSGFDAARTSEILCESHRTILTDILSVWAQDVYCESTAISTMSQLRMTRRFNGEYTISDAKNRVYFPDGIGIISDWRRRDKVYEVPSAALYTKSIKNLVSVGRRISVSENIWDIARIIPVCAVIGQAAGTAATLTDDIPDMDIHLLQQTLERQKQKLHFIDT